MSAMPTLDDPAWAILFSGRLPGVSLGDIRNHWSYDDIADAMMINDALDAQEDAIRFQQQASQAKRHF